MMESILLVYVILMLLSALPTWPSRIAAWSLASLVVALWSR